MAEALTQNLKLIGRYSILRELRRDRHTVAYLAMDPVLNRELVLKAVQLHPRRDEESVGHEHRTGFHASRPRQLAVCTIRTS